jgi:hypothetical protein
MALRIVNSLRLQAVSAIFLALPAVHRRWDNAVRTGC